jgi:hypothetical protein
VKPEVFVASELGCSFVKIDELREPDAIIRMARDRVNPATDFKDFFV